MRLAVCCDHFCVTLMVVMVMLVCKYKQCVSLVLHAYKYVCRCSDWLGSSRYVVLIAWLVDFGYVVDCWLGSLVKWWVDFWLHI